MRKGDNEVGDARRSRGPTVSLVLSEATGNPFSRIEVTLGSCYWGADQSVYPKKGMTSAAGVLLHRQLQGFNRSSPTARMAEQMSRTRSELRLLLSHQKKHEKLSSYFDEGGKSVLE